MERKSPLFANFIDKKMAKQTKEGNPCWNNLGFDLKLFEKSLRFSFQKTPA